MVTLLSVDPGTGKPIDCGDGPGRGFTVNVAWPAASDGSQAFEKLGDAEYAAAFAMLLMPIFREFDPDIVIVSAGFDAAEGDTVGGFGVTPQGFAACAVGGHACERESRWMWGATHWRAPRFPAF